MNENNLVNSALSLKGVYYSKGNESRGGPVNLPAGKTVPSSKIEELISQLENIKKQYMNINYVDGVLLDIKYVRVIPKSSRVETIFSEKNVNINDTIVGAKFDNSCHRITHYFKNRTTIDNAIIFLKEVLQFVNSEFNGTVDNSNFNLVKGICDPIDYTSFRFGKTKLRKAIVEICNIEYFDFPQHDVAEGDKHLIVSLYKTEMNCDKVVKLLNLNEGNTFFIQKLDEEGFLFQIDKNSFDILIKNVPYLICNSGPDLLTISSKDIGINKKMFAPLIPNNEPTIGVLDTGFTNNVYFKDMVKFKNVFDDHYDPIKNSDFHGTEIDSILVDGSSINGDRFDDGCGLFQVRHFAVARKGGDSSAAIINRIKDVVKSNPDIHVWNLSLGSDFPIDKNYISFEGNFLDNLQFEHKNIIFVVSGTNIPDNYKGKSPLKIGAPADSINSIVVNAVDANGNPASYSRLGGVLSFFNKPDLATFGGDHAQGVRVCNSLGEVFKAGTSYAAPWISRKMCFLMDKMNLTREAAKALLIDSAAGWNYSSATKGYIGYGIVPTHIDEILKTKKNEIRFVLTGKSSSYMTYNYSIPVPMDGENYPFIARATMCYFPSCSRNQGVDYTDTELSIKFGRINNNGKIKDINDNVQDDPDCKTVEEAAREYQRKWDNVKFISSKLKKTNRALKSYDNKMWGISVISKQRISKDIPEIDFGIVVTLNEINGRNRIDNFIENCKIKGWEVEIISIQENNDLYNEAQEKLDIDD